MSEGKAFKPFPEKITYGDMYNPAMEITDPAAATAYFERCVEHAMRWFGKTRREAETLHRANLGYWAGYYGQETRLRIERLFKCEHPVFGPATDPRPSPEVAFAAGMLMAQKDPC